MNKAGMDESMSGHGELGGSGRTAPPERAWAGTPEPALNRAFAYIQDYWPELTRPGAWLAFPLPNPYVRPGGFFKMFVYWDSYFILLGLVTQGQWELAAGIVDNMIYAVERLGHVPCYVSSKTACRSRSQPPFLTSAIREVAPFAGDREWLGRAVAAAEREYFGYWMAEPHLTGRELVNRYLWDAGEGFYRDLDLRTGQPLRAVPRALSAFVPLWAGLADARQAASMAAHLPLFEHDHGLAATEPGWTDGDQHSYPTGWAYSHWYVAEGLRRAGYREDAVRIALMWLRLVAAQLDQAGVLLKRYNVVDPDGPTPGRYPPQPERGGCSRDKFPAGPRCMAYADVPAPGDMSPRSHRDPRIAFPGCADLRQAGSRPVPGGGATGVRALRRRPWRRGASPRRDLGVRAPSRPSALLPGPGAPAHIRAGGG